MTAWVAAIHMAAFQLSVGCGELTDPTPAAFDAQTIGSSDGDLDAGLPDDARRPADAQFDDADHDSDVRGLAEDSGAWDGDVFSDGASEGGLDAAQVDAEQADGAQLDGEQVDAEQVDADAGVTPPDAGQDADASIDDASVDEVVAIAAHRFTWAYDASELCRLGPDADWPATAGSMPLIRVISSTTAPPRCGATTDGLRLDILHQNRALDLRGGGCWRSDVGAMPDVPPNTNALLRIIARFPAGDSVNRNLGGLWASRSYFRWFHRGRNVYASLRSEAEDGSLPLGGAQQAIEMESWQLVDVLVDANSGPEPRLVMFVNGQSMFGQRIAGLGVLLETTLSLGTSAQCSGTTRPSGNQTVLFLGMSIGGDAGWFDADGEAHLADCRSLGLCE